MTLGKVVILAIIGIGAALLFAYARPARAAECFVFEAQLARMVDAGAHVVVAKWAGVRDVVRFVELNKGTHYEHVTRAFMVFLSDRIIVGLEVDGCLLDPVYIGGPTKTGVAA